MSQEVLESIGKLLKTIPKNATVWIGYSGGIDSQVLLHAVVSLRELFTDLHFVAVHANHGISKNSNEWQEQCADVCLDLRIGFRAILLEIPKKSDDGLESAARIARYNAFKGLIKPGDYFLTAHHEEDQAETVLIQLFRGSGIKGISAMPTLTSLGSGFLARPFLNVEKDKITDYAKTHYLTWINDESNKDIKFSRNFVRLRIMPTLKSRWPIISKTIARCSAHLREVSGLLDEFAQIDLENVRGRFETTLSIKKLQSFSYERKKNVIRHWLKTLGFQLPSKAKLDQMLHDVVASRIDAEPIVSWGESELRKNKDDLFAIHKLENFDNNWESKWDFSSALALPGNIGVLTTTKTDGGLKIFDNAIVRFRSGGEKIKLQNRTHSHSLKKLFQEWDIPPWERNKIPLIFSGEKLVCVVGYAIDQEFICGKNEKGIKLEVNTPCITL